MNSTVKPETESRQPAGENRLRVSSKGKRLFALLLDFIFSLLLANTLVQVFREEHWDLVMQSRDLSALVSFYGSIAFVLLFKDIFGRSLGKLLLGMTIRKIENFEERPALSVLLQRNLLLLIFPLEGVVLMRDSYARRLADKWWKTVVLDDQKAMRPTLRILLGNIILFGFFTAAILFQRSGIEKTSAYQTAELAIRAHPQLQLLLEQVSEIEEPEMHLDLRENTKNPSLVRVRVGEEDSGKEVIVSLTFRRNPPGWEVLAIEIKAISEVGD
ncbi:MAG: RDD family protein [SAR324 cluster bacterium]|nr:RDD family protein [SAR324 cluster bacterium]MBL7034317.1 RDD family protein [SAR324 cluster bacterium]